MSSLALSVLLSLISAVAYAAGAIIQERVAATGDNSWHALLRNGVWWVAVLLNGAYAILHVVALAYGPLSLVQPLGALTIVFALPMAALFVGRRAGATAWRGALMATAGLGGLLALTGNAEPHTLNGPEQVLLASVTFGAVGALVVLARTLRPSRSCAASSWPRARVRRSAWPRCSPRPWPWSGRPVRCARVHCRCWRSPGWRRRACSCPRPPTGARASRLRSRR